MSKLITSVGLAALGALALQTDASAQSKPWSVSASLRGFYDDNYATAPSASVNHRSSLGFEISPSASYLLSLEQTSANVSYTYAMKYFEDRASNNASSADHSHQFSAGLEHAFSELYRLSLSENFVMAQEPELLSTTISATPFRSNGNNVRNTAELTFSAELTRLLNLEVGYANSIYDYQNDGPGAQSALLDRVEHLGKLGLRWTVLDTTVASLNYQFGLTDQTSKDSLNPLPGAYLDPSTRDSTSHFFFAGVDHSFTPELKGYVRAGGQHTTYPHAVAPTKKSTTSPYFDAQASYEYNQGSKVGLGIKHQRYQTDVVAQDSEATVVYGSVNHQFTAKISANLIAMFQTSEFSQGANNGLADNLFTSGLSVNYKINEFLAAEAGYNYDRLDSDIAGRSYYRNRVFIGIKATY